MGRANELCGVYMIKNNVNNKVYIGSSKKMKTRLYLHKWELSRDNHHSTRLQRSVNKHGAENFDFKPLLICSETDKLFYEQLLIDAYQSFNPENGYNINRYVEQSEVMRSWNSDIRQKSKDARRGKNYFPKGSINYLNLVSAIKRGTDHPMYGKTHSQETREKMSKARKGIEAWNKGLPSKAKGINRTQDVIEKIKLSKRAKNPEWKKVEGKELLIKELFNQGKRTFELVKQFNVKRHVINIIVLEG